MRVFCSRISYQHGGNRPLVRGIVAWAANLICRLQGGKDMIIDSHCHLGTFFYRFKELVATSESLVQEMTGSGVDKAVICPIGDHIAVRNKEGNDLIANVVRRNSERFIGMATVNPWYGAGAVNELERGVRELGLKGLKLHPLMQGFETNDPLVYPVIEKAIELAIPTYVHAGTPILAVPYKLVDLAAVFPEARLIMGHAGWDFHFDVIRAVAGQGNIFLETSKTEFVHLEALVANFGADRLLFGSDYPFSNMRTELAKIELLEELGTKDREKILWRNCARLFDIERGEDDN